MSECLRAYISACGRDQFASLTMRLNDGRAR
jgi:hypothetical protein